jgi:hypothetical protein
MIVFYGSNYPSVIASWNWKEKKIIWDKHNCHLGAIAGEGLTKERPSMASGGREVGKYKG